MCDEFVGNWLLLVYALCALTAIAHAIPFFSRAEEPQTPSAEPEYLTCISVRNRGRQSILDLADVDWIETQGNYLCLHAGPAAHMIREASVAFKAKLDPKRFVRIHRCVIVALYRIRDLRPIAR